MNAPNCPDCNVPMEEGHILDMAFGEAWTSHWQPGPSIPTGFFGKKQPHTTKLDQKHWRKVVSYCCPQCRLLREYAMDIE